MHLIMFILHLAILVAFLVCINAKKPNIVIFLTDDQDELLGGIAPMPKTQQLIANKGVIFENSFVSTPVCCPSRASILTGLYQHNHRTLNNSLPGGCSSTSWQNTHEKQTFATLLHMSGYRTFFAGKYLNQYGHEEVGGAKHVPPGWDWWIGLLGNSKYYDYKLSINGTESYYPHTYLSNVIQKYSSDFLKAQYNPDEPFLMVLSSPAPHAPFTPEDRYEGRFNGTKVPRTPNFNHFSGKTKHWLTRMPPNPLPDDYLVKLDGIQAKRWETLLSVDDLVESVIGELEAKSILDETYIIFTSDNGFHLGHFGMPWDKRQMYETDIRVPLVVRGPNIPKKQIRMSPVVNIDIASTVMDMAGVPYSLDTFDGLSFLPIANGSSPDDRKRSIVIEYHGEGNLRNIDPRCPWPKDDALTQCTCDSHCKCQDSRNNTYNCLRRMNMPVENFVYCQFMDDENFTEYYNLLLDPHQLENIAPSLSEERKYMFDLCTSTLSMCRGKACHV